MLLSHPLPHHQAGVAPLKHIRHTIAELRKGEMPMMPEEGLSDDLVRSSSAQVDCISDFE